jgi:hypothetical protein
MVKTGTIRRMVLVLGMVGIWAGPPADAAAPPPDCALRNRTGADQLPRIVEKLENLEKRLAILETQLAEVRAARKETGLRALTDWLRNHRPRGFWVVNVYSSDPNARITQLLNNSEDLRKIGEEWQRIWFTDHPTHLTPERVDGAAQ